MCIHSTTLGKVVTVTVCIDFNYLMNTMSSLDVNNKGNEQDKSRKKLRVDQELLNPCFKEYNLSAKCLEKNLYDYDQCQAYFENYNSCKKFWAQVVSSRKRKNIKPYLPLPQDREKIKAEYLSSKNR